MTLVQEELTVRISETRLTVEAGSTGELAISVSTGESGEKGLTRECKVWVEGLPETWYTLSAGRLRVRPGADATAYLAIHPSRDDRETPYGDWQFAIGVALLPGGAQRSLSCRVLALPQGGLALRSRLLDYLPNVFRTDMFLARFLLIFQSVLDPIEETIGNTHLFLDPGLTPREFLPWLASWVGISLDEGMDEASQRELIRRGVEIGRWKGTRRGLREELKASSGARALIVENFHGMRLGQDAAMGINTDLGVREEQCISVTLVAPEGRELDLKRADSLVADLKPAHVRHIVRLAQMPRQTF